MLVRSFFFFHDTATTQIYTDWHTLSLHDALPISRCRSRRGDGQARRALWPVLLFRPDLRRLRSDEPDRALGGGPLAYHCPGDLDRWRTVPALPRLQGRKRPAAAHGARARHYPGARTVGQRGQAPDPEIGRAHV